jgi:hypothetical protein
LKSSNTEFQEMAGASIAAPAIVSFRDAA